MFDLKKKIYIPPGGSQVSGTRVVCPGAVAGERHLPGGRGPGAPKPPRHGPFGGHVGVCVCVCVCVCDVVCAALGFAWLATLACLAGRRGYNTRPALRCLPFRDCGMGALCLIGQTHAGPGGPDLLLASQLW